MMWRHLTVNLADLLFSVSEAMDLSDTSLVDHQIRTAFVSSELARAARLDYGQTERLFVAALLHDIGALSPEEKIGAHVYEDLLPEPHCQRGGRLFREAFWLEPSARIVDWHHTSMAAHRSKGRSISDVDVFASQVVFLSDHLERAIQRDTFILHQVETLRASIHDFADTAIHGDVIALFDQVSTTEDFWLNLVSKDLGRQLRERSLLRSIDLDYEAARSIASVFKDMTDFRSRFTATHSSGVAACARSIGQVLGFTGKDLQQIDLAGLMHDIGKLVVPNAILCKPTSLTPEEYAVIRQHPYYTHRILSRVNGFEQIAEWAAFHHERLDGSGYGGKIGHADLDVGAKVVAVADIATAIAEQRPYREPGDESVVVDELRGMVRRGLLESRIVEALADNYRSIMPFVQDSQAKDEARYIARYAMIV
jgi:HD-GYP domain-containing protein (c-di-GMP phosphodiesterase class II)